MADLFQTQITPVCNPDPLELAWAAGFFDGEGNCRMRIDKKTDERRTRIYGTLVVQIGQTDREVLDRFLNAVGVGTVNGPYTKIHTKGRPPTTYYTFHTAGRKAVSAFNLMRPYLSRIKRNQGDAALAHYEEFLNRPRLGNGILRKKELAAMAGIEWRHRK